MKSAAMPGKTTDASAHTEGAGQLQPLFPVEVGYVRYAAALGHTGILTHLPKSGRAGVIGVDGNEYPIPTLEEVREIFDHNRELVCRKVPQGFDRLELTPMAMPGPLLMDRLKSAIIKHAAEGNIYQTRLSPSDPLVPVRVNKEKQVWTWDTLREAMDTGELIYFPREYTSNHHGQSKLDVIHNGHICAVAGWSVGLVENRPVMPREGQGKTIGGRKQLEIGSSPREYLQMLQTRAYEGETGKTVEDFVTAFLVRLDSTNEVSNDVSDHNALWCLGQYLKIAYAEVVPTGRWHRDVGRVRLDMHRTANKLCTTSWGGSSVVRLVGP